MDLRPLRVLSKFTFTLACTMLLSSGCKMLDFKGGAAGLGGGGADSGGGAHGGSGGGASEGNGGGGRFGFGALGGGGPTAQKVAKAVMQMKRQHMCDGTEKRTLKCARMVSRVLRAAGVNVPNTASTDTLYASLLKIGWTHGACRPGSVRHDEGTGSFDHVGIVGTDNTTWHNHGSKGTTLSNGTTCGYLDNSYYSKWMSQGTRCLNAPN